MYAKLKDGKIAQFPYTIGQLRKDNPNVSFPKNITTGILQKYGVVGVVEGPKPTPGPYQTVARDAEPHRPITGYSTNEDATDPVSGEIDFSVVGLPIYANYWMIGYHTVDMFSDYTDEEGVVHTKAEQEAAYQNKLDENVAEANRTQRDALLEETDWLVIKAQETGVAVDAAWATYRQALRDITTHANWPHLTEADWPVKP